MKCILRSRCEVVVTRKMLIIIGVQMFGVIVALVVIVAFLWWMNRACRRTTHTQLVWGTIENKDIDLTGVRESLITIRAPSRELVVLEFDTREIAFCSHPNEADCWHYEAKELDNLLTYGLYITTVKTSGVHDGRRQVFKLVTPARTQKN